ncbi:MAG: hypothetical protein O3B32_04905 [Cyanobacteria bacterium]|nr:hypothetical protein [Cyanobacteriota bacterium]
MEVILLASVWSLAWLELNAGNGGIVRGPLKPHLNGNTFSAGN